MKSVSLTGTSNENGEPVKTGAKSKLTVRKVLLCFGRIGRESFTISCSGMAILLIGILYCLHVLSTIAL